MHLRHTVHVDARLTSTTFSYRDQLNLLDRPESGVRTGWLRCEACGAYVGLRVQSVARTRARRRRELLALVLSVLAAAGLAFYVSTLPDEGVSGLLIGAVSVLGVVLFVAVAASGSLLLMEQGMGIAKGRANGPHRTTSYSGEGNLAEGIVNRVRKPGNAASTPAEFIDEEF